MRGGHDRSDRHLYRNSTADPLDFKCELFLSFFIMANLTSDHTDEWIDALETGEPPVRDNIYTSNQKARARA